MPTRVNIHHRIISAIRIQVKTVDAFGIKVFYRIGVKESARFGVVVTGLQIIKLNIIVS